VLGVGRLGTRRRVKEGSSECGAERRRWGCALYGRGGGGEEGRRPAAVEFYSSSVLKELKGEEETGRHHLDGGNEEGGAPVRFGYSRVEESGRRRCTT
jgi:hypothetical protein